MSEQMEFTEEEMEAFRRMMASLREDIKLAVSSLKASLQSLSTGRSGDDSVILPVQASSNAMELVTSSVVQVEPPASSPAMGEPLRTTLLVPDDTKTVAHTFCSTECQIRDAKDLTSAVTSEAAPKTHAAEADTIPVLAVAPDLEPAFYSATPTASATATVTMDIIQVFEAASDMALDSKAISGVASTPATGSMVFLSRHCVATMFVEFLPLTRYLYGDSELSRLSSTEHITSKVPLHRPLPWPSYMEVYAARDETRPRPWPSFRDRYGCEFPGKGVEQVLQYSSDSVSAINGVVKLKILNSYGNLWPFTVGIIDHSMCIDMELRCWNEVVRFLKHWRFASECVQSTSELKLSSICFIASESVNRLGTGVHVHGSATFLLWRLLLISLAAPSTFLNLALIPDELVYVLGMYMAGLHGLLSVDEHQPSACPDATVYCVQQSTAIFEAVLRPEKYRAGFSLQYSVLGVAVKVIWTSVAPCCLMVNILAEKPNNMVIMASWESGYKSFITPFLTWKSVACILNSVALIKWKVAWPLYDLPIYCSIALIGLHVPANLITPGWIYETLKDHSYMSGLQKFRDGICIGTTICACCLAWISEQKERIPYVFVVQEQCEPKLRSDHEREELLGIDFFTWSNLGVLNQSSWCALKPWSPLVLEISSLAIAGYGGLFLSWTEAMVSYLHCSFTTPDVFSRQHHWQIACSSQVNISAKGFDMPLHQPVTVIGPVCKMMSRGVQPFAGKIKQQSVPVVCNGILVAYARQLLSWVADESCLSKMCQLIQKQS